MKTNRRKFISTTTLGVIGFSYARSLATMSSLFSQEKTTTADPSILQLLTQASYKRKSGFLEEARSIYNQVISINSNEIRAYDGIRKILLQDKYKELEVLDLYLNGYNLNPTNVYFKQRIAKEYMRLALGNKKFKEYLNFPEDLLEKAKAFLEQAKIEVPTDEQMQKLIEKADFKLNSNANILDARLNEELKAYKKENHTEYKNRFDGVSEEDVKLKLDALLEKTSNDYRDVHVRELYRVYVKKLKESGKLELAAQYSKEMYLFDKGDSKSLKIARNICKKDKKYDILEDIERQNESIKRSFWAKIALFDVLYKRYRKEGIGSLNEMKNILDSAGTKKFSFYHNFEYKIRQVKLALIRSNINEAQSLLTNFADTLIGTSSAHFINKFNMLCVIYYLKTNDRQKANLVFEIALKQNDVSLDDAFLKKLVLVNEEKDNKKEIHNKRLAEARMRIFNI